MVESVKNNEGFYVSRYEMGIEETGESLKPISKIGVTPISAGDERTYQWYGLHSMAKNYDNPNTVIDDVSSQMIWGCQYDAIINSSLVSNIDTEKVYGTDYGNYGLELLKTGTNTTTDSILNVFDLGGNICEWT